MFFSKKWEKLCRKCGVCCMRKKVIDNVCFIDFNSPCQYLDIESNSCFVYEKRFEYCSSCKKMTLYDALFCSFLPDSCGYAECFRVWKKIKSWRIYLDKRKSGQGKSAGAFKRI